MASFLAMGKRETWYAIGFVTDKLLRALKETARREKLGGNGSAGDDEGAPARTASVVGPQGKGAGGNDVKKMT